MKKVAEGEVSRRRHGLRKQVPEATEGPLEPGGEREVRVMCLGERGVGGRHPRSSTLRLLRVGSLGAVPGEDLNRIFISFAGMSFQGGGLH